ncbi:MAG: formate dehydrogenase accessory protein FdhE [Thiothrix sp.]|nr:formate dehydrogenase accessory protein FdhE [Thiothrix sp.]HPE60224.1 formate dehydrogenase accessory protein FdhE [Thiolinea sp.]
MSLVSRDRLVDAGNMGAAGMAAPRLLLPEARTLFRQRARRFSELAAGHPLQDWLQFCAVLSEVQQQRVLESPLPVAGVPAVSETAPWLAAGVSDDSWTCWRSLLDGLQADAGHAGPALAALRESLQAWSRPHWQAQAQAWLQGEVDAVPAEAAPFLGAALQLEWVQRAAALPVALSHQHQGEPLLCPVCGSHPMVSLIHIGDPNHGVRYLVCSLCSSQWQVARAKCTNCASHKPVSLLGETPQDAIQGECCDVCHSYVKVLSQVREVQLDPCADDLATLGLDVMLVREGYGRAARNLLQGGSG